MLKNHTKTLIFGSIFVSLENSAINNVYTVLEFNQNLLLADIIRKTVLLLFNPNQIKKYNIAVLTTSIFLLWSTHTIHSPYHISSRQISGA